MSSTGYLLQQLINGLVTGSVYALLASAYALVHAITGRIILSFGDIAMFGAFWAVYATLIGFGNGLTDLASLALALLAALAGTAGLGIALERTVFARLRKASGSGLMIAALGAGLVIEELMRLQSGAREQWLPPLFNAPVVMADWSGFAVRASIMQLACLGLSLTLLSLLGLGLMLTSFGRLWRAVAADPRLAELCGINTTRVASLTFGLAAALSGSAGFVLAVYYGGVSFYMGLFLGLKAMIAGLIGGFGSLTGAIVGGFLLAGLETSWSAFFPLAWRDVAVFAIILALITLKPEGLTGLGLRRDSEKI